jgi:hypothetical protein
MQKYVLYHAGCADGFGAAFAAWLGFGDTARYLPVSYGPPSADSTAPWPLPELEDDHVVYLLDFSYPEPVLRALSDRMRLVVVLDHHSSAANGLRDFYHPRAHVTFDTAQSGALLAWRHFFPFEPVPLLLRYVQDRDLWQWQLPESREVSAALATYPHDFDQWRQLMNEDGVKLLREQGRIALRVLREQARRLAAQARMGELAGHTVPIVNTPLLRDEVGEQLLEEHPDANFAVCWYEKGGLRRWSLRSRRDFDCSTIAKQFGGGGHPQSCGFEFRVDALMVHERHERDEKEFSLVGWTAGRETRK